MFAHQEVRLLFQLYLRLFAAERFSTQKLLSKNRVAYFEASYKILKYFFAEKQSSALGQEQRRIQAQLEHAFTDCSSHLSYTPQRLMELVQ